MSICTLKTLDAKHNKIISTFENKTNDIEKIENIIEEKKKLLLVFTNKKKKEMTDEDFQEYYKLKEEIKKLKEDLDKILSKKDISKYFLDNSDILKEYYSSKKKIANYESFNNKFSDDKSHFNKKKIFDNKSLLDDFFKNIYKNYITNKKKNY